MNEDLQNELEQMHAEIEKAEVAYAQIEGGLLKALVATRLEILRTTEALVRQRIHSIESGAPVVFQVPATQPDLNRAKALQQEISAKETQLSQLRTDVAQYSGGLVLSLKLSAIATHEQTIALLQQNMLAARYGFGLPPAENRNSSAVETAEPSTSKPANAPTLVAVRLLSKRLIDDYLLAMDLEFVGAGLQKTSRAIKGSLNLDDLFGETRLRIDWTIDQSLKPGGSIQTRGMGFHYNQFMENHQWVHRTAVGDIVANFEVVHILYQDGSRDDF